MHIQFVMGSSAWKWYTNHASNRSWSNQQDEFGEGKPHLYLRRLSFPLISSNHDNFSLCGSPCENEGTFYTKISTQSKNIIFNIFYGPLVLRSCKIRNSGVDFFFKNEYLLYHALYIKYFQSKLFIKNNFIWTSRLQALENQKQKRRTIPAFYI